MSEENPIMNAIHGLTVAFLSLGLVPEDIELVLPTDAYVLLLQEASKFTFTQKMIEEDSVMVTGVKVTRKK